MQKARYIQFFGGKTHPRKLDAKHIEKFLSHLATKGNVAASTQRQALNALVFLYRDVLNQPLDGRIAPVRSKRKPRLPTVLTQEEVQQMLRMISGTHGLMAKLLYGAGLRLMECVRLRIQDVDFGQDILYVRGGKGGKDRTSILPQNIREELRLHIEKVTALHHRDLEDGYGEVYLPEALSRKLSQCSQRDTLAVCLSGQKKVYRPEVRP